MLTFNDLYIKSLGFQLSINLRTRKAKIKSRNPLVFIDVYFYKDRHYKEKCGLLKIEHVTSLKDSGCIMDD